MAKKKKAKKATKKKTTKKKVTKKAAPKKKAKKVVKKATKKVAKKAAKKTAKKATKKVAKKAAKKTAKKATKKVTKVAAKKAPAKKATKKVEKKATKKTAKAVSPETTKKAAKPVKETKKKAEAPAQVKIKIQKEVVLTDAEGRVLCRIRDCDQPAVVESYCRYHYLLYWRKIQARKRILNEGKLEKYIEELTTRYPLKYLEMLKRDLSSESDFLNAIQELEIDESVGDDSGDFEDDRTFIEEVRGMTEQSDRDESEY